MKLFLSTNQARNRQVIETLERYGLTYDCVTCDQIERCHVVELMTSATDCFEFLSPHLLSLKRQEEMRFNELVHLVLRKPSRNLRLPLILAKGQIYPDVSQEELRTFLPRNLKLLSRDLVMPLLRV